MEKSNNDTANRALRITRMLSAPIDLVWEYGQILNILQIGGDQTDLPIQFTKWM